MKKIISLVLALALVCGLAVNAFAANLGVSVDKKVIEAGETVTVTVTLDEEITGVTSVQAVLTYDKAVLTYVGATAGEGYGYLGFTASNRKDEIKINSGSDFSLKTLPAGTVATLTFTANEAVDAAELALAVSMTTGLENGDSVDVPGASVSVVTCPGHNYIETKSEATCLEPATVTYTCEYCGDTYAGESEGVYGDHALEYVDATKTCTEDGLKAHFYCTVCEKRFEITEDWEAGAEVTVEDLFAPAGHEETQWPAEVYNDDGSITREYYCVLCYEVLRTETVAPGENGNPLNVYPMDCPATTVEVPAGESVFYQLNMFGGNYVVITGGNFTVNASVVSMGRVESTASYNSVNGAVKFIDTASRWGCTVIEIVNNGSAAATYTIAVEIPLGAMENPETLYIGENTATTYEGVMGYYMQWVADCNGTFTVTLTEPGEYWGFYIYNTTSYEQTADHNYDTDGVMTDSVEFSIGDVILVHFMNSAVDEETGNWIYPAGDITFEAGVEYVHTVQHVEAKAPSCFEEGNIEYWYCSDCGAAWANEELTQITNLKSVVLPAACPDVMHVEAKAPSCFEEGNIEYWYCTNPEHGTVWIDENLTQISNHMSVKLAPWCQDVVHVDAVEPGCHYEGNVEHWYCTNPEHGTVWTDEERTQISNHKAVILPALGGDVVHVEAADATCTEAGHIEYWYCEECEQVWQDEALTQLTNRKNVITEAAHGHVYDDDKDMVCNVCEFDRTNSQTGDVTVLVAAAAAIISATGVVALPIAKKKFF